jgi:oxygen-independent coproporphyrinogen-3 oxidase
MAACERVVRRGLILNVDLMYGLPAQSEESFESDLAAVAAAGVQSVTLYDLRSTARSPLGRSLREEERLDLAHLLRWRQFVGDAAGALGFAQTRWHTWKRLETIAARHERAPSFDQRVQGHQLGVGMSARSHLRRTVYRNAERIGEYLRRVEAGESPVEHVYRLREVDLRTQFVSRSLGDGRKLERAAYAHAFGHPLESDYGDVLARLAGAGLVLDDGDALELSPLGKLVYDRVMLNFYPKHAIEWLWAHAA